MWPFRKKKKPSQARIEMSFGSPRETEAYALYSKKYPALDRHFKITERLQHTYTPSSERAVETSIKICQELIAMSKDAKAAWLQQEEDRAKADKLLGDKSHNRLSLPSHLGFRQYAIILEKRGDLQDAVRVAKQAQAEGWNGDWPKRIARCEAKVAKAQASSNKSR